jgi:hypothetical protein
MVVGCMGKKVNFNDKANQTFVVDWTPEDIDPQGMWYSQWDISMVKAKDCATTSTSSVEDTISEKPKKMKRQGKKSKSSYVQDEFVTTFGPHNNSNLVYGILLHQASCRLRGFRDPEGIRLISEQFSKRDKKRAFLSGQYNARAVSLYLKDFTAFQKATAK